VRERVEEGDITVHWVPGEDNPADMLTRPETHSIESASWNGTSKEHWDQAVSYMLSSPV